MAYGLLRPLGGLIPIGSFWRTTGPRRPQHKCRVGPGKHPLRLIRMIVNEVLSRLDGDFAKAYASGGRPSIAPERLLRALLLQAFYTIRSERQLMEQLDYNLLYRWFVGLGVDEAVWVPTVFTKNRDRLLEADVARKFLAELMDHNELRGCCRTSTFRSTARRLRPGPR